MQERTKQRLSIGVLTVAVVVLLVWLAAWAQGAYPNENTWTQRNAARYQARAEHRLWDESRVDLLSDEYAIEVDWSYKLKEAVGQCEWYSIATNKKPGVILLVKRGERDGAIKDLYRATAVCTKLDIRLWIEEVADEPTGTPMEAK